jgi:hypothetical protein
MKRREDLEDLFTDWSFQNDVFSLENVFDDDQTSPLTSE